MTIAAIPCVQMLAHDWQWTLEKGVQPTEHCISASRKPEGEQTEE